MRSLFVSAALALMVGVATAAAQTPTPGSSTASSRAPAPPGQAQPSNVTAPTISAGPPYRLDLAGDANITGTYRVNGVPISATSNWTQAGNDINYTTGNVGVGTPAPGKRMHISTSTNAGHLAIGGANQNAMIFGTAANSVTSGFLVGRSFFSDDANTFFIYDLTANTNRLLIDASGNVEIGTGNAGTNLSARLHVEGGADTAVSGASSNGSAVHGAAVGGTGVSGFSSSGTGVEGRSPSGVGVFGSSTTSYAGQFSGNVFVSGTVCAGNISCASDARLKQNVTALAYGLREVLQLRPVRWQWNDTTTTQLNLGLIAQDVEPVLPELILRNVDTKGALGLNYFGFVPVLINAIQEQQDSITALKAENASLETRIRALEQALQRLLEPR